MFDRSWNLNRPSSSTPKNAGRDLDCPRPALGRICGGTWVFLVIALNTIRRRDACCHSRGGLG
jgi:hypothetical protein